jgi:hypothetical protein
MDAGPDAGGDVGRETSVDAGPDVLQLDAEAGVPDVFDTFDVNPSDEPAVDAPVDSAMDGATDARDASPDAGSDAGGSDASDTSASEAGSCGVANVVINEVQTAGTGGASDEWIELHNNCAGVVDLSGAQLVYRSASGVTDIVLLTFAGTSISANGYLVVANMLSTVMSDATFATGGLSGTGGGVALRNAGTVVDSMGYGTATNAFVEMMAATAPPAAQSTSRLPDGTDSNNNAMDFSVTGSPTPRAANH